MHLLSNLLINPSNMGKIVRGTYFSNHDDDIARHIKLINAQGNMLISRFKKCSEDVKVLLFKTYMRSMYCCQLWTSVKEKFSSNVSVAYNNVFRHF